MGFQRILARFSKEGEARFLSHHDLMRLFERALRRAALPLRMTQGFNPHPRLAILSALPLGVEADEEPIEVELEPPVPPDEVRERLAAQLPKGIRLRSVQALPEGVRARVESLDYAATLPADRGVGPADVERLLACQAVVVERATPAGPRRMDLRPALEAMAVEGRRLAFRLRVAPEGTPRPTEVLDALLGRPAGSDPAIRVRRTKVNLVIPTAPRGVPTAAPGPAKGSAHATQDAH